MFRRVVDWRELTYSGRTFVTGAGKVFWYNLLTFLDMSSWRTQIGYSSSFESGSSDRLSFEWLLQGFQVRTLASWNATGLPTSTLKQVGMINSHFWLGWIFHLPNSWATETILKPTVASTSSTLLTSSQIMLMLRVIKCLWLFVSADPVIGCTKRLQAFQSQKRRSKLLWQLSHWHGPHRLFLIEILILDVLYIILYI